MNQTLGQRPPGKIAPSHALVEVKKQNRLSALSALSPGGARGVGRVGATKAPRYLASARKANLIPSLTPTSVGKAFREAAASLSL